MLGSIWVSRASGNIYLIVGWDESKNTIILEGGFVDCKLTVNPDRDMLEVFNKNYEKIGRV